MPLNGSLEVLNLIRQEIETPAEFLTDLLFQEEVCMTKNRAKAKLKTGGVAVGVNLTPKNRFGFDVSILA